MVKSIASNYILDKKTGRRIDTESYVKQDTSENKKIYEERWGIKLGNSDNREYASDGSPYLFVDVEIEERRKYLWDIVSDIFNYYYKYFKQRNDESTFYQIFETAYLDTRYTGATSKEHSIKEAYDLFQISENPIPHIRLEYTTLESINTKTKVVTPIVKPKKASASKPKKEVPKVSEIKTTPKIEEKKEKIVTETKEIINVLEISKYTKLVNGYRIDKVNNVAKKIIIDDSVAEISSMAFRECSILEEVTLSKNLKTLKFGLFANLMNLVKVNFVEGLEKIENNVFEQCGIKGEIRLPDSLKVIGNRAFYTRVPNLLKISISKNSIDSNDTKVSFHPLITLDIRGKVKEETKNKYSDVCTSLLAFECELNFYTSTAVDLYKAHEAYVIPNTIKKIAFRKKTKNGIDVTKIKKFYIGSHVEELFDNTFVMFTELEELEFDEDIWLNSLPSYMIGDCKITHIRVPDSVEYIARDCFVLCKSLKSISVSKDVMTFFLNLPDGCEIIVRD